jgi:hypothetical protein
MAGSIASISGYVIIVECGEYYLYNQRVPCGRLFGEVIVESPKGLK